MPPAFGYGRANLDGNSRVRNDREHDEERELLLRPMASTRSRMRLHRDWRFGARQHGGPLEIDAMFKVEDAVSVDTSEYELAPEGMVSKSPGLVLAVTESPELLYHVRVWLPLGTTMDVTVPPDKVGPRDRCGKSS